MNTEATPPRPDPIEFVALQVVVLQVAVRALHATHPEPAKVEAVFRQLIAQMQAQPAFLGSAGNADLLRRFVDGLFQPPKQL